MSPDIKTWHFHGDVSDRRAVARERVATAASIAHEASMRNHVRREKVMSAGCHTLSSVEAPNSDPTRGELVTGVTDANDIQRSNREGDLDSRQRTSTMCTTMPSCLKCIARHRPSPAGCCGPIQRSDTEGWRATTHGDPWWVRRSTGTTHWMCIASLKDARQVLANARRAAWAASADGVSGSVRRVQ